MKLDNLAVTAQVTRKSGSADYEQLTRMYVSGERVVGLVEQFPWMPFVVESVVEEGCAATFNLRMVARK